MHVYYLISPNRIGLIYNPGVFNIANGCRYLIKQADPDALFIPVSNIEYIPYEWDLLFKQAHCLLLAGGAFADTSDISVFWNDGVWDLIASAQARGIPFADLFSYASAPFPLKPFPSLVADFLNQPRNRRALAVHKNAALVITRDALSHMLASTAAPDAALLPCASFWSPDYYHVTPDERLFNIVSVFPTTKDKWFADALIEIALHLSKEKPTYIVCNTLEDYRWITSFYPQAPNLFPISDPQSLLDLYSHCDKLVSAKLHAAIPAFALGCKVIYISYDSRSLALDLFGIPSIPYTDLATGALPFRYTSLKDTAQPDPSPFIELFRDKVVSRF